MDNFFVKMFQRRETTPTTAASSQPVAVAGGRFEEKVHHVTSQDTALTIAAVHRAIEVRMKTMSQIDIEFQQWDRVGECFVRAGWGYGRLWNYLLQVEPNPLMTAETMWQQAEYNKITYGNAFIWIERDELGDPLHMWLCDGWGSYDPITLKYTLSYQGMHGHTSVIADRMDVLHVPNTYRYQGSIMGMPTLTFARQTLTLQATNNAQAQENSAKGGKMKLIIGEDTQGSYGAIGNGLYDKSEMTRYASELNDLFYSQDVIALRALDKAIPISMNAQQLQLLEQMGFGIPEVARFYAVPKALLMDDSNSSYRTPEEASRELLSRTISPAAEEWTTELQRKLLNVNDYGKRRFEAKIGSLFKFDRKAQAEINKMNIETGVMSVNELRRENNMPQIENGDVHYVSANLKPISEAMNTDVFPNNGQQAEGGEQ